MAIDMDDEILQDFLVEAGEILEELNEQLVDLEQRPDDYDLLNAVFRGFHTIKGGAGFLKLDALVAICHCAEDVFNILRQGQRRVDAALMDAVLQVLDVVNEMFALVQSGAEPEPADPALIALLHGFAEPADAAVSEAAVAPEPAPEPEPVKAAAPEPVLAVTGDIDPALGGGDEITEAEFDHLLDQLHGKGKFGHLASEPSADSKSVERQSASPPAAATEDITEEEFDALLDQIHGKGKFAAISPEAITQETAAPAAPAQVTPVPSAASTTSAPPPQAKAVAPAKPAAGKPAAARKAAPTAEATIRVDTARLDDIMNMVGELVLVRNRLETLKSKLGDEEVAIAVANLDVVTADLQNSVMKTRMQPVKKVFGRFPRVVRDLARSLKKEIDLELHGEETDLDKNLIEALSDPMVHLVRNAVDHGIETPEEREMAGKPRRGKVVLSAEQAGDHILLTIADDGKGMDAEVLRRKAVEKGMMDEEAAARLDEKDCYNLIFAAGFSTKTEISDVSGRGVGMDVVKTRIAQMNGQVEVDSELGKGSLITIKLPLTLAILPTLMVVIGDQPFALPLSSVVEIFNLDLRRTNVVDGQLTVMVRERALPLFYLDKWLVNDGGGAREAGVGHVVVVNVANIQVCLVVDHLIGQEEVVIKPLGLLLQGMDGMAGATITGDGKIALILDIPGLMRKYVHR
jgi:two-component system chemotaxis sensor kinase CheA